MLDIEGVMHIYDLLIEHHNLDGVAEHIGVSYQDVSDGFRRLPMPSVCHDRLKAALDREAARYATFTVDGIPLDRLPDAHEHRFRIAGLVSHLRAPKSNDPNDS